MSEDDKQWLKEYILLNANDMDWTACAGPGNVYEAAHRGVSIRVAGSYVSVGGAVIGMSQDGVQGLRARIAGKLTRLRAEAENAILRNVRAHWETPDVR